MTDGSNISQTELASLLSSMGNVDYLAANGINMGGEKFMYISSTNSSVCGKNQSGNLYCAKTKTTLLVGITCQADLVIKKMAYHLIDNNY